MGTWFDDLEARLNQQLEAFLQANPAQQARLQQQEAQDRQAQLGRERVALQQQAQQQRQALLELAAEIRQWQGRIHKAQAAGATELAAKANVHLNDLMLEGRRRWQQLAELGARFASIDAELQQLQTAAQAAASPATKAPKTPSASSPGASLEAEWAAFEADQELQQLKRRQRS